jgi:hypothetical protein
MAPSRSKSMEHEQKQIDILSEILTGPSDVQASQTEDLEKIIYRDPKELQRVVHRAFRLSDSHTPTIGADLKRLIEPEKDDDLEHQSFQLTSLNKKKTTIYFSKKIHLMLKSAKYRMRKMVEPDLSNKISMSSIINNALVIVLHEFEVKGEKSILLKQIVKKLKK